MPFCDVAIVIRTTHNIDMNRANNINFPAIFPNLLIVVETLLPGFFFTMRKMFMIMPPVVVKWKTPIVRHVLLTCMHMYENRACASHYAEPNLLLKPAPNKRP